MNTNDGPRTNQNLCIPFERVSCWKPCEKTFQLQRKVILDRVATLGEIMYGRARVRW